MIDIRLACNAQPPLSVVDINISIKEPMVLAIHHYMIQGWPLYVFAAFMAALLSLILINALFLGTERCVDERPGKTWLQ